MPEIHKSILLFLRGCSCYFGVGRPPLAGFLSALDIVEVVGSSPIDPTKLQWEFVAPLGTAS